MFKTIEQLKNKEKGFSLLELSVAVGIAAIVAAVAVTATTGFVNGAAQTSETYETAADSEIANAKASFDSLWGEGEAPNSVGEYVGGSSEPAVVEPSLIFRQSNSWVTREPILMSFDATSGEVVLNNIGDISMIELLAWPTESTNDWGSPMSGSLISFPWPETIYLFGGGSYFYVDGVNYAPNLVTYNSGTGEGEMVLYLSNLLGENWYEEAKLLTFELSHGSAVWVKRFSLNY